ncbi:MAG: hypothetical protein SFH39_00030 [Candidatus Magnetobacterium sp. LHC-1]
MPISDQFKMLLNQNGAVNSMVKLGDIIYALQTSITGDFTLDATDSITVDAGTTDHTGAYIFNTNLDVNSANCVVFYATIDIGTALSAGEIVKGTYYDMNELAACADTSGLIGYDALMTGINTAQADLTGFKVTFDGTKSGGDLTKGLLVDGNQTINNAGETVYGVHVDFSGLTHTEGILYGEYIDVSAAVTAGSSYGLYIKSSAAAEALHIDADTTDRLVGNVVSIDVGVNSAAVNAININLDIGTLLSGAEYARGVYQDINEVVACADTSGIFAYDALITSFATGRADLVGYRVTFDGSKTTADTVKGLEVTGTITNNTATLYGSHIDLSGITHTAGTTYGQYVDVSATVSAGSAYGSYYLLSAAATGIYIDAATTDHTGSSIISLDIDVNSANCNAINAVIDIGTLLSGGEVVKGIYLDMNEAVANADTSALVGYDLTLTGFAGSSSTITGFRGTIDGTKNQADSTRVFHAVSTATINNAGEALRGLDVDFSGVTHTDGITYGVMLDVSATVASGSSYGLWEKLGAATTGIYIDAGTIDHGAGNIIDVNLDVNSANVNLINATIDIGTLLTAGEAVNGSYFNVTEAVVNEDTSAINGYNVLLTSFATGRADLTGFKATLAGSKTTADNLVGLHVVSTATINTGIIYGELIDLSGITHTDGTVYAQYIDVSAAISAGSTYAQYIKLGAGAEAIHIDAATTDKTAGNIINVDIDVNSASVTLINATVDVGTLLSAGEIVKGVFFDIDETLVNEDTSGFVGFDTTITGLSTSRADLVGYRVTLDGTKDGGDTSTGFTTVGTVTLNNAGETLYGVYTNLSGITHTNGVVAGEYIDVSATVSSGNAYGIWEKLSATAEAIHIDAGTIDHTAGSIINIDLDINSASVTMITATIDIGTLLSGGEIAKGVYLDINEVVANADTSGIYAYDTTITGFATGAADLVAYKATIDGSKTAGDTTKGVNIIGTLTINNAGEYLYGSHIDMSGITHTNGILYGQYVDVSATVSSGTSYGTYYKLSDAATAIYIDAGTNDHIAGNIIDVNLDVNSASVTLINATMDVGTLLSAGEFMKGVYLDINEVVANADTSGLTGFECILTGFATGAADLRGFKVTIDGSKTAGDTSKAFEAVGTVTLNNAGEYLYGQHIDFSGVTQTNGIVYGSYIDVSQTVSSGTSYGLNFFNLWFYIFLD